MNRIKVTVSGSFRRHMPAVQAAVQALTEEGAEVLSPSAPVVVDAIEDFVFVASDRHRSPRLVQDRHLAAITASDFLWLECPDGYVGPSAALEIGFAVSRGIPVLAARLPSDITMRQYVRRAQSCATAVRRALRSKSTAVAVEARGALLVDPMRTTESLFEATDSVRNLLTRRTDKAGSMGIERELDGQLRKIAALATV